MKITNALIQQPINEVAPSNPGQIVNRVAAAVTSTKVVRGRRIEFCHRLGKEIVVVFDAKTPFGKINVPWPEFF